MATVHVVSLFLPYTVHFHDRAPLEDTPEPRARLGHPPIHARLSVDLRKPPSSTSLLDDGLAALAVNDIFSAQPDQQLPITPGNPRSLMRTDAHVSDWGKQAIFNQPQSRAGPLPSGSILQFAKEHEELQRYQPPLRTRASSAASRAASSDRAFDGKDWTIETALHGNGGLANAVREDPSQEVIWHGTLDFPTDTLSSPMKGDIADLLANEYQAEVVYVSESNFLGHYDGYCKTILWPIFHYQVPMLPKSRAFADQSWQMYVKVNQLLADKVVDNYKRGDMIWVHDYHLLLVPKMIRERLPHAQVGFFLHCAFPSSEVFRTLWRRRELLEGVLGANLVGFQIEEYAEHFLQACSRVLTVEATSSGVQLDNHFVDVMSLSVGINITAVDEQRDTVEVQSWIHKILERYEGKRIIVARDRLDSVSGVRHKLLSFELFLNKFPEWKDKVVLIQVATSTSEQAEHMPEVFEIVSRIEAVHSSLDHQPLVFLQQDIPFSQYLAILSVADVLIVGSLRDGMNLTPHDYIICQDGKYCDKKYGALILSEFTGASAVFGKHHLMVNPWDYQAQVRAIKQALEMSPPERKHRWSSLHEIVVKHSGGAWASILVQSLRNVHEKHDAHDTVSIPRLSLPHTMAAYKDSKRRVFILDYEGTLAAHRTQTGITLGDTQRVTNVLNDLVQTFPGQTAYSSVYIMSALMPDELERYFKMVPQVGMIAENGCFLKEAGVDSTEWEEIPVMAEMSKWKRDVKEVLKFYLERLEGTYMEERHCSLLLRFDKCEDGPAIYRMMGECADHINGTFTNMRVGAVPIDKAVLIESLDHSKASVAQKILDRLSDDGNTPDFLFVAGDDREDESIFRWANALSKKEVIKHVFTVSVGKRNTEALATITQGTSGLLTTLGKLAKASLDARPVDYFSLRVKE